MICEVTIIDIDLKEKLKFFPRLAPRPPKFKRKRKKRKRKKIKKQIKKRKNFF
jgi:hypothetical protein